MNQELIESDFVSDSDIAIIGMSCRFPGANNPDQFWDNLWNGVESVSWFKDEEILAEGIDANLLANPNYVKAGGVLEDIDKFDAFFFDINGREAEIIDPQHRIFLECASEAIEKAGYNPHNDNNNAISLYAGVGMNSYFLNNVIPNLKNSASASGYQAFIGNDKDFLPTRVSYKLNLKGASLNVNTACSSSLVAVHLACQSLLSGECDMAMAGAVSIYLPQINLADVAYTLQIGRRTFDHRRILVCDSVPSGAEDLKTLAPQQVFTQRQEAQEHPVAFMFSGQGSQYVNMGRELYENERVFRENCDRCFEILQPYLDISLKEIIFPPQVPQSTSPQVLRETQYAQPAIFIIEYALAQLWMSWGIQPQSAIGHSIGEYVAATLAGVFSLEDALTLVAHRGRLMQQLPPGAMVAVSLSAEEVKPLLGNNLWIATINTPKLTAVSGTIEAVAALEQKLEVQGIDFRHLHTSHGFHSPMMEQILEAFTRLVAQVKLNPPQMPYLSNVTGNWITATEATDSLVAYRGYHRWLQTHELIRVEPAKLSRLKPGGVYLITGGLGGTGLVLASHLAKSVQAKLVLIGRSSFPAKNEWLQWLATHPENDAMSLKIKQLQAIEEYSYADNPNRFVTSINWDAWQQVGMAVNTEVSKGMKASQTEMLKQGILPSEGVEIFDRILNSVLPQVLVSTSDFYSRFAPQEDTHASETGSNEELQPESYHSRPDLSSIYVAPSSKVEIAIAKLWQKHIRVDKVGIHDNFFDLGGDSLIGLQVIEKLNQEFDTKLPATTIYKAPTVSTIAQLIEPPEIEEKSTDTRRSRGERRREKKLRQRSS